MSIKVGLLVEFMQDNTPTLGYVLDEQGGKIRLLLANRREINLTQSRLLPWIGPIIQATAKEDIVSGLIAHKELRQKTKENIDKRNCLPKNSKKKKQRLFPEGLTGLNTFGIYIANISMSRIRTRRKNRPNRSQPR